MRNYVNAKHLGKKIFTPPENLLIRWLDVLCILRGCQRRYWRNYETVVRRLRHKALIYAAYQFARQYPDKVGVIHNIWGYWHNDGSQLTWIGESVLVRNGQVQIVPVQETRPHALYYSGIDEYYTIAANLKAVYGYGNVVEGDYEPIIEVPNLYEAQKGEYVRHLQEQWGDRAIEILER